MATRRLTRDEKKARTREQVLRAAADIFPSRGFHRTSVDQVAEQAGLSIGAVYSNFGSKAELFLALYQRQMDRWVVELPRALEGGGSRTERIRAAGAYWTSFLHNERDWFLVHMEFWAYVVREPDLLAQYASQFQRLRLAVAELLQRNADELGVALPLPAGDLAAALQALNRGLLIETLADPGAIREDLFSSLLMTLAEGVASGGSGVPADPQASGAVRPATAGRFTPFS